MDGTEIQLTPLEFEILATLARDPGVVFSRELLMDRVWGYRDYAGGRVVDSHVARIRRKLGEDGNEPRFIRTIHGVGIRVPGTVVSSRPLERLPTIRAKLGSTIIFAVGMTVILIFLILGVRAPEVVPGHRPAHAAARGAARLRPAR